MDPGLVVSSRGSGPGWCLWLQFGFPVVWQVLAQVGVCSGGSTRWDQSPTLWGCLRVILMGCWLRASVPWGLWTGCPML